MKPKINIIYLGLQTLSNVDELLAILVKLRMNDDIDDTALSFFYEPSLSVGAKPFDEHDLLKPLSWFENQGIHLLKSNRGGGLTFYWPGQIVFYPILKLDKSEQNIPQLMYNLEETVMQTAAELGVAAHRKRDETAQIGLWVGDEKVASMGIKVSKWVTSYGFVLNLFGEHEPSHFIRPCGLDVKLTTVQEQTGILHEHKDVLTIIKSRFSEIFNRSAKLYHIENASNERIIDYIQKL